MKTFSTRPSDVRRAWHVLDATGQPLGRLSTQIATYLRGKHKPIYAPHLDTGDFVIVVNASKVRLTGNKLEQKRYYHHSGYPGGLKTREVKHVLAARPERVIEHAVRGMLPKGPLGLHLFNHLKVYGGPSHPHAAQVNGPDAAPFVPGLPASNSTYAPRASETAPVPAIEAIEAPEFELEPPAAEPVLELAAPEPELELPAPEPVLELAAPEPEPELELPEPELEPSAAESETTEPEAP